MKPPVCTYWCVGQALIGQIIMITLAVGVDSTQCAVAIQCIGGRSIGKYVAFIGTIQLSNRYDGMKKAFANDGKSSHRNG
jgi:hypothetical protein